MNAPLISPVLRIRLLRLWHALLLGGAVVAWATADEDTYAMHFFAGWLVTAVLPWRFLLGSASKRPPLLRYSVWAMVLTMPVAAISGIMADQWTWMEDPHEIMSNVMIWAAAIHAAIALYHFGIRRWLMVRKAAWVGMLLVMALTQTSWAADPRTSILERYAKQAGQSFNSQRGQALYLSQNQANPEAPSCSTCHTTNPTAMGRHAKTGRPIDPMAVSANPKRFTDAEKVDERFNRDCQNVLGRPCNAVEKGDYITFLSQQ